MEIKRYNIPKLPRNKYNSVGAISRKYSTSSPIITNYNADYYDGLDSSSIERGLTANQGRILNENKLSKTKDDTAKGIITFEKGLRSVENIITKEGIVSNNYTEGVSGYSIYKDPNGKYNIDIDNANIRGRLDVQSLQVEEAKYIGGKLYCTKAGLKCSNVLVYGTVYRCVFNNSIDNVTIHNQFVKGDLAFCQTFNNNRLRRYWREVIAVGDNYIDLSKTRCEQKSDIPETGDDIVQLGNISDVERQSALVLEPLQLNIYKGISNYILPDPIISLNPKNSKIDADQINFLGKTIINNNFKVDTQGNLSIKGKIEADEGYFKGFIYKRKTVITNDNINQYFDYNQELDTYYLNLEKAGTWVVFDKNFNKPNIKCSLPFLMDQRITGNFQDLYDNTRQFVGNSILIYNYSKQNISFGRNFLLYDNIADKYNFTSGIDLNSMNVASLTLHIGLVKRDLSNEQETSYWKGSISNIKYN